MAFGFTLGCCHRERERERVSLVYGVHGHVSVPNVRHQNKNLKCDPFKTVQADPKT